MRANDFAGSPTIALDIGCEGGRWSQLLEALGWKLICADIAPGPLRLCRNRLPASCCVLVDPAGVSIPCARGSVRLMSCIEVQNVIGAKWFIDEVLRVMERNGLLVGTFLNQWSLRGLAAHVTSSDRRQLDYYERPYSPWRRELTRRGFRMVYEEGCCWLPFRRQSNSGLIPVLTRVERALGLRKLARVSPWIVFIAQKLV